MSRPSDPNARVDLLRAAELEFVARGLDSATVEAITTRAHRSKGSFYLHFDSKEEAFRQIVETFLARMANIVGRPPEREPADFAELCALWLDRDVEVFDFLWQNRGLVQLLLDGGKSASFAYLTDEFAERARESCMGLLADGVARGHYRADLDVELASLAISGAYDRVARQLVKMTRKPDLRALLSRMQALVLDGIVRRGEPIHDSRVKQRQPRAASANHVRRNPRR